MAETKALILDYYGVIALQTKGGWRANTELIARLMNLKQKFALVLASNSYAKTLSQLDPQLDSGLFDLVALGGATGLWKPDQHVFSTIAIQLKLSPAQILAIDDNAGHLAGAQKAGLSTYLYKGNQELFKILAQIKSR